MSLDMPSQGEFEQLVSEKLREESWTFEEAEQILFTIQLYKLLNTLTLEPSTTLDDNVLALTLNESTALLEKGLQNQKLHDISSRSFNVPMEYIASAATGLTTATSPTIAPALTMISQFSPLALAAIPILIKKKSKHQKDTKQVTLAPSKVAAYAKLHGKWLDIEEQPEKNAQESMDTSESCVQHSSGSLPADEILGQTPEFAESRILLLNSLKLYGVNVELILPEITAKDLDELWRIIKDPVKPDPNNLVKKNKEMRLAKVEAINFMLQEIQDGCKCNHANLARYSKKTEERWNTYLTSRKVSEDKLKELSILIVPPERRYCRNQHTQNSSYDPSQCKCQQPNHKPAPRPAKTPKKQ